MCSTKKSNLTSFRRILAASVIVFSTLLTVYAGHHALQIKTSYSPKQFQPKHHDLLKNDKEVSKIFRLKETSPHIVLLSLKESETWIENDQLQKLSSLTESIQKISKVQSVVSLANIESAVVDEDSFYIGSVKELSQTETKLDWVLKNALLSPQLISKTGKDALILVTPKDLNNAQHSELMQEILVLGRVFTPNAKVQIGGPAAIRTEVTNLLSTEILVFIALSLAGALAVLLVIFQGWSSVPTVLFVVLSANTIALGVMSYLGLAFTVLSTTVPIIVTVTAVAICTHSLVKMSEYAVNSVSQEKHTLIAKTFRELLLPHILTALTTMVGFGTLVFSEVPLIKEYGLTVAASVPLAALMTLCLLPALLYWVPTPQPRSWLSSKSRYSEIVLKMKFPLFLCSLILLISFSYFGRDLNWSSRMFDDLPSTQPSRQSTEFISQFMGGVVPLNISIGSPDKLPMWDNPKNIKKLSKLMAKWSKMPEIGSTTSLVDFLKVTNKHGSLPKLKNQLSETYLIYGMAGKNPLENFVTPSKVFTRIEVKFKDIPADQMQVIIESFQSDLQSEFPRSLVKFGGLAATIHPLNEKLSVDLMLGFFQAMVLIVLLLAVVFRSLKWSLVSVIPNLIPPAVLLGALALTKTPIKPGIAIIFAISLGIAFDNTVYILGRLKQMLKENAGVNLPIKDLLRQEASPCFVSSLSLFAGFSVFLFSYFNMNQTFGVFMLLSIMSGLIGDLVLLPTTLNIFPNLLLKNYKPHGEFAMSKMVRHNALKSSLVLLFIVSSGFILYSPPLGAGLPSAKEILEKVEQTTTPPSEETEVEMQVLESDGSKKVRRLTIKRKKSNSQKALVRIHEPKDLKGVSLLSLHENGDESQWLYLPSSKRSRRIVGSGKKGRFLDSELTYEDFSSSTYNQFSNKLISKKGKLGTRYYVIESKAKNSSDSSYGKVVTWVSKKFMRIDKTEYYDQNNKLMKTMSFKNYRKYGNKYWRAHKVEVKNLKEGRGTILSLKSVKLKKLPDSEFSKRSLGDGA